MSERYCQSCSMPIPEDSMLGTEADGSKSVDYCNYCYQNGAFTREITMEEMIEFCAPFMQQSQPGMSVEAAKSAMKSYFPQLKRWQK